jgi:hypothetical protein
MWAELCHDVNELTWLGRLALNEIFIFGEAIIPLELDDRASQDAMFDVDGKQPIIKHLLATVNGDNQVAAPDTRPHLTQDFVIHLPPGTECAFC